MTFIFQSSNLSCVSTSSSCSYSLSPSEFLTLSLSSAFQFKVSDHNRSTIHHFLFARYAENEIPILTALTLYYFISLNYTKQIHSYEDFLKLSKFVFSSSVCSNFLCSLLLMFLVDMGSSSYCHRQI